MQPNKTHGAGRLEHVERTFMFTDIVASTAELERVGSDAWSDVIAQLRDTVSAVSAEFGGYLANFLGDGFLLAFETPVEGVLAALNLQHALLDETDLGVRIGIESGEVVRLGADDYVGLCLNTASRLCDLSDAGQALLGPDCVSAAQAEVDLSGLERSLVQIRGLRRPVVAYLSEAPSPALQIPA